MATEAARQRRFALQAIWLVYLILAARPDARLDGDGARLVPPFLLMMLMGKIDDAGASACWMMGGFARCAGCRSMIAESVYDSRACRCRWRISLAVSPPGRRFIRTELRERQQEEAGVDSGVF